jgi:hypothetical protein
MGQMYLLSNRGRWGGGGGGGGGGGRPPPPPPPRPQTIEMIRANSLCLISQGACDGIEFGVGRRMGSLDSR